MREQYNCYGEALSDENWFLPLDEQYFDDEGFPLWNKWIQHGDKSGFDTRHTTPGGKHIERVVLPKGKRIIRFGLDGGSFTTDYGEKYENLSLPYKVDTVPYHEYIVTGECEVECLVDKGIVAPGFSSRGGAVQYRHYVTVHEALRQGILKEDYAWLQK